MFTAESSPHLSLSSLSLLPRAVCAQSQPLVSSASLMGLQSCPATWPPTRAWSFGGCWMAPTWKLRGPALRMLGRRFTWTKPSLGSLCVKFWRGTVPRGPGPLHCLAAMVSNGISRKSSFWFSCSSKLRGCWCPQSTKFFSDIYLPYLPNPAFRKWPLDFLLPLVPWTGTAHNHRWDNFVEEVLLPSSAARMELHLSLFLFFWWWRFAPSCALILSASLETQAASYSDVHPWPRCLPVSVHPHKTPSTRSALLLLDSIEVFCLVSSPLI